MARTHTRKKSVAKMREWQKEKIKEMPPKTMLPLGNS